MFDYQLILLLRLNMYLLDKTDPLLSAVVLEAGRKCYCSASSQLLRYCRALPQPRKTASTSLPHCARLGDKVLCQWWLQSAISTWRPLRLLNIAHCAISVNFVDMVKLFHDMKWMHIYRHLYMLDLIVCNFSSCLASPRSILLPCLTSCNKSTSSALPCLASQLPCLILPLSRYCLGLGKNAVTASLHSLNPSLGVHTIWEWVAVFVQPMSNYVYYYTPLL